MKTLASILFILLTAIIITSCTPAKYIADSDKEMIFSHDVKLSKTNIKEKLMMFVNEKYMSSKSVMQTNEDGLLSGNGIAKAGTYFIHNVNMEFTFIIKYTDNSYKVKWLIKDVLLNQTPVVQEQWGYYLNHEEINTFFKKNDDEMFSYVNKNDTNF